MSSSYSVRETLANLIPNWHSWYNAWLGMTYNRHPNDCYQSYSHSRFNNLVPSQMDPPPPSQLPERKPAWQCVVFVILFMLFALPGISYSKLRISIGLSPGSPAMYALIFWTLLVLVLVNAFDGQ